MRDPVPVLHLPIGTLESGLDDVRRAPADSGRLELIVARPCEDERELLDEARLDEVSGLVGDRWDAGSHHPDAQVTVMNARAAELIAGERARWPLAGDQLYVDFDIGVTNLPPGTQLEIGGALLQVTAEPHRGCGKFSRRFGVDALKFVNSATGRELNLRGINTRVIRGGTIRTGDPVRKLAV